MFGNMFSDITVDRNDSSGVTQKTVPVPIAYGPKEKWLARLRGDPSIQRQVAITLPRMSFEVTSISYDSTRAQNRLNKNTNIGVGNNTLRTQYEPSPYNITVSLYAMFANNDDAMQVVEQILPFFQPEWTSTIVPIPEMGISYDIPTVLNDMSIEDTYDGDFETRRAIIYTFTFTIKGKLFGPISNKGIIRRTLVDLTVPSTYTASGNVIISTTEGPHTRITVTPGLLANGSPTTNSAASVAISTINANSNYGISIDSEDFFDGINRHLHDR
jgi:hypothetical protein